MCVIRFLHLFLKFLKSAFCRFGLPLLKKTIICVYFANLHFNVRVIGDSHSTSKFMTDFRIYFNDFVDNCKFFSGVKQGHVHRHFLASCQKIVLLFAKIITLLAPLSTSGALRLKADSLELTSLLEPLFSFSDFNSLRNLLIAFGDLLLTPLAELEIKLATSESLSASIFNLLPRSVIVENLLTRLFSNSIARNRVKMPYSSGLTSINAYLQTIVVESEESIVRKLFEHAVQQLAQLEPMEFVPDEVRVLKQVLTYIC